ncbi:hypothetical protein HK096_003006, partial [Nowakowskiella sp. JEL0078]
MLTTRAPLTEKAPNGESLQQRIIIGNKDGSKTATILVTPRTNIIATPSQVASNQNSMPNNSNKTINRSVIAEFVATNITTNRSVSVTTAVGTAPVSVPNPADSNGTTNRKKKKKKKQTHHNHQHIEEVNLPEDRNTISTIIPIRQLRPVHTSEHLQNLRHDRNRPDEIIEDIDDGGASDGDYNDADDMHIQNGHAHDLSKKKSKKKKNIGQEHSTRGDVWYKNDIEEKQRIREFWLQLGEEDRRAL